MSRAAKQNKNVALFENSFLEPLTKAPLYVSASIYISIIFGLLAIAYQTNVVDTLWGGALIFIGAILFWTLFEYFAHRYFFHVDEYFPNSKFAAKVAYTFHGIHHDYPQDEQRIVMPPVPGLMIIAIVYVSFLLTIGSYVYIFMPGFLTGYLLYTRVHYLTHRPPVPKYLKKQYRHHAMHHYKYPEKAFGVSTSFWDRVFNTMPPKEG